MSDAEAPNSPKRRRVFPKSDGPPATDAEILNWVLHPQATIPCLLRDVLGMESRPSAFDYMWLGKVPCRNVMVTALLVGVQTYDNRIVYTVDDGTAVLDCVDRRAIPKKSPTKPSRYKAVTAHEPPPTRKPAAKVGQTIKVTGRVMKWHNSRQILVQDLIKTTSANDELRHWMRAAALHSSWHDSEPFFIPNTTPIPPPPTSPPQSVPTIVPPSISQPSPSKSASCSPTKSQTSHASSRKYRHPNRLPSKECNSNTFRIYLKSFLDLVTTNPNFSTISVSVESDPATPTKAKSQRGSLLTPKRPVLAPNNQTTPRPSQKLLVEEEEPQMQGVTLSYLRRVSDLSTLATRVVLAEAKRRAREEKKKATQSGQSFTGPKPSSETLSAKKKRLFKHALAEMMHEGSIVLWEGDCLPVDSAARIQSSLLPWKPNVSTDSSALSIEVTEETMNSFFSTSSSISHSKSSMQLPEDDLAELSDPSPSENSYISLTTEYLAKQVDKALKRLEYRFLHHPDNAGKPFPGVSCDRLLSSLRNSDERWAGVSVWLVEESVQFLHETGAVREIRKERWGTC